jgi:xanthine dioxygenase
MKTPPGRTAFFSSVQLYQLLSREEMVAADNSWVEYAPYPYMWLENCKGNNNGLGVVSQGREHKMEDMPEWKEEFIKTVSGKLLRTISAFGRSYRMM